MLDKTKKIIKGLCAVSVLSLASVGTAYAQLGDIGAVLRAGAEDATLLTKEYLRPFPTGFGTGLNAGWTESAAPKKTLGFSLQIRPSIAIVPSSAQSFDISALSLQKIEVAAGENPVTPTVAGDNVTGTELIIRENGQELTRFNMPKGVGIPVVPAPVVQAGLGLVKGTDITVRFFPETEIGEYGNIGLIGGAIKHDITQWLPGGKLIPVDISVMAGFNRLSVNANLDVPAEGVRNPNDPSLTNNPNPNFDEQEITTEFNSFVVNALVGKSLPLISVYGGVGYQTASLDLNINGDYPVSTNVGGQSFYNVVSDPVSFGLDSESSVHLLGGFRLRLGVLAFYGEATVASYFTANAGIGISFR
ncbi:DUF6588 family protein [Gracilimonas tropica]|uniref:DUF6588 family protein n=1 Tax=Gracilimonas tropica TaxID=454600 RepID=UPI00037F9A8E|nr:DUF6588 family protein [Gracilimonas tropica]